MEKIMEEVLRYIFSFVSLKDLHNVIVCCKKFKDIVENTTTNQELRLLKIKDLLKEYIKKIKDEKICGSILEYTYYPIILGDMVLLRSKNDYNYNPNLNNTYNTNGKEYGYCLVTKDTRLTENKDKYNPKDMIYKIYPMNIETSINYDGLQRIKITNENCSVYSDNESYFFVDVKNTKMNKLTYLENNKFEEKQYELIEEIRSFKIKFIGEHIILQRNHEIIVYDYKQKETKYYFDMLAELRKKYLEEDEFELYLFCYNEHYITFCFRKKIKIHYIFEYGGEREHDHIEIIGYINLNTNTIKFIKTNNTQIDFTLKEFRLKNDSSVISENLIKIFHMDQRLDSSKHVNELKTKMTRIDEIHVRMICDTLVYIDKEKIDVYNKDTLDLELRYKMEEKIVDFTENYCVRRNKRELQIYNSD